MRPGGTGDCTVGVMTTLVDPAAPTAVGLATAIATGARSPVEVVTAALERAHAVQPELNCFTAIWDDALGAAERAAAAVTRGDELGPLHGVPVAVKDTTPVAGRRTTLGSYAFEHWVPDRDAYIVTALRRAGAVIIGQTTSPEFAHTLQTDSPLWGVTRNPHDPERTPGGSSGGSGAAVASGCVSLAEGSDMGGSVRIPASWSGVVGLKPSLGRIPMDVLPGLFDSISHHGPLARCADDARLFLAATQGPDDADIQSIPGPLDLARPLTGDVRGMRFGLSIDLGCFSVDPEIAAAVTAAAERLTAAGAAVEEVDVAAGTEHEQAWMTLWSVFMATYFGAAREQIGTRMDPDVAALIDHGRTVSAVEYKQVELVRTDLWRRLAAVLADHDALLCPSMAVPPWPASKEAARQHRESRREVGISPAMTTVFNLVPQCPVISVPVGAHVRADDAGLPIGLQVVGRRWRDDVVLEVARAVELNPA
jgi:Asp-tRNA(Asn)/Glu-tRNA(Gln) amidotransferase A subunit family amidase